MGKDLESAFVGALQASYTNMNIGFQTAMSKMAEQAFGEVVLICLCPTPTKDKIESVIQRESVTSKIIHSILFNTELTVSIVGK